MARTEDAWRKRKPRRSLKRGQFAKEGPKRKRQRGCGMQFMPSLRSTLSSLSSASTTRMRFAVSFFTSTFLVPVRPKSCVPPADELTPDRLVLVCCFGRYLRLTATLNCLSSPILPDGRRGEWRRGKARRQIVRDGNGDKTGIERMAEDTTRTVREGASEYCSVVVEGAMPSGHECFSLTAHSHPNPGRSEERSPLSALSLKGCLLTNTSHDEIRYDFVWATGHVFSIVSVHHSTTYVVCIGK